MDLSEEALYNHISITDRAGRSGRLYRSGERATAVCSQCFDA